MSDSRRIHYGSPVLPFDYPNDGKPIWPCGECLPWHVEVVESEDEGLIIREWHAVDCSTVKEDDAHAPHES